MQRYKLLFGVLLIATGMGAFLLTASKGVMWIASLSASPAAEDPPPSTKDEGKSPKRKRLKRKRLDQKGRIPLPRSTSARRSKEPVPPEAWERAKAMYRVCSDADEAALLAQAKRKEADRSTPAALFQRIKEAVVLKDRQAYLDLMTKEMREKYYAFGVESEILPLDAPRYYYMTICALYLGEQQKHKTVTSMFVAVRFRPSNRPMRVQFLDFLLEKQESKKGVIWSMASKEVRARRLPSTLNLVPLLKEMTFPPRHDFGQKEKILAMYRLGSQADEDRELASAKTQKPDYSTPEALFASWRAAILRRDRVAYLRAISPQRVADRHRYREVGRIKQLDTLKYYYLAMFAKIDRVEQPSTDQAFVHIYFSFRDKDKGDLQIQKAKMTLERREGRWFLKGF